MDNMLGLGLLFNFRDLASPNMLRLDQNFAKVRASAGSTAEALTQVEKTSQGLGAMGVGLGLAGAGVMMTGNKILGFLAPAISQSRTFEQEISRLQFTAGATNEVMEKMRAKAIQVGKDTAFGPTEATKALYELISAGMDAEQAMTALSSSVSLVATAGGRMDMGTGAAMMAATLQKFNLAASEAPRVADMMTKLTNLTAFQPQEMGAFVNSLQDAPAETGQTMEQLFAMGGLLRNLGQEAPQSGQSVHGFGRKLGMLSGDMEKITASGGKGAGVKFKMQLMKQLGLDENTIWDAQGRMRKYSDIMGDLIKSMVNMSDKQKMVVTGRLFGDQAKAVLSAVDVGTKAYFVYDETSKKYVQTNNNTKRSFNSLIEGLTNSKGTASKGANDLLDNQAGSMKRFSGSIEALNIMIGKELDPILTSLWKRATDIVNVFITWGTACPALLKVLGMGVGLAGILVKVTGGAMLLTAGILGLRAGLGMLTVAANTYGEAQMGMAAGTATVKGVMKALMTESIMPLLTKLFWFAAVAGIIYLAWKNNFGRIREIVGWVTEAWSTDSLPIDRFKKLRESGLLPIVNTIMNMKIRAEQLWKGFSEELKVVWDVAAGIWEELSVAFGWFKNIINDTITALGLAETNATDLKNGVSSMDFSNWEAFGKFLAWVVPVLLGLSAVIKIVTAVQWLMNLSLWACPIVWAIGAILVLIGVAYLLGTHWDAVTAKARGFWNWLIEFGSGWGGMVFPFLRALSLIVTHWDRIKNAGVSAWRGIKAAFQDFLAFFGIGGKSIAVKSEAEKAIQADPRTMTGGAGALMAIEGEKRQFAAPQHLATGGYTLGKGLAMLHPNEVVVNAPVTAQLSAFLNKPNAHSKVSVSFEPGAIQINVANASEEEAEKMANLILKKLERKMQLKNIMSLSPARS